MLKYSIVTINYQTAAKVQKLWESLQTHLDPSEFEFVVLDNNSGHEEVELLNNLFDQEENVHFIPLQQNLGFGGGYAEATRFVQGEYLALINPDIELTSNCLETLSHTLESEPKTALVAPQLTNPDGSLQKNARPFPTLWDLIARRFGRSSDTLPAGPVPWVQGSFMLLRRRFYTDVLKGFDPRFFLFFEDTDLCRRTWLAGFEVRLDATATAIHGADRLSGSDIWKAMRRKTFWIHLHSAVKYFWKYKGQSAPKAA